LACIKTVSTANHGNTLKAPCALTGKMGMIGWVGVIYYSGKPKSYAAPVAKVCRAFSGFN
jgi:hypothetical protein